MVRPQRGEYVGAYYHVMSRGRVRQMVFHGEQHYNKRFLTCLEQAHKRFAMECHAYCQMGNHYHLLVRRTPRGHLCLRRRKPGLERINNRIADTWRGAEYQEAN